MNQITGAKLEWCLHKRVSFGFLDWPLCSNSSTTKWFTQHSCAFLLLMLCFHFWELGMAQVFPLTFHWLFKICLIYIVWLLCISLDIYIYISLSILGLWKVTGDVGRSWSHITGPFLFLHLVWFLLCLFCWRHKMVIALRQQQLVPETTWNERSEKGLSSSKTTHMFWNTNICGRMSHIRSVLASMLQCFDFQLFFVLFLVGCFALVVCCWCY